MIIKKKIKVFLICLASILLCQVITAKNIWSATLTIEVYAQKKTEIIEFQSERIMEIGINNRFSETRVELVIPMESHILLENLTKDNIGRKIIVKIEDDILFFGKIYGSIKNGKISFLSKSENNAKSIIKKIGRIPDYYLNPSIKKYEDSIIYKSHSVWEEKAIEACSNLDYKKAEEFAIKAIEEIPNKPLYYQLLGAAYFGQGKKKLALETLLKAEVLSSQENLKKYPGINLSIAELYADFGEYNKAIKYFQKVLVVYNQNFLSLLGMAKVYEKMGKIELALKQYRLLSESDDEYSQKKGLEGINRLTKE